MGWPDHSLHALSDIRQSDHSKFFRRHHDLSSLTLTWSHPGRTDRRTGCSQRHACRAMDGGSRKGTTELNCDTSFRCDDRPE